MVINTSTSRSNYEASVDAGAVNGVDNIPSNAKGSKVNRGQVQAENAGVDTVSSSHSEPKEETSLIGNLWNSAKNIGSAIVDKVCDAGKQVFSAASEAIKTQFNEFMKNPAAYVFNAATLPGRMLFDGAKAVVQFCKDNPKLVIGIAIAVAAAVIPGAAVLAFAYNVAMNVETVVDVIKAAVSGDWKTAALLAGVAVGAMILGPALGRVATAAKGLIKSGTTVVKDAAKASMQNVATKFLGKEFSDLAKMGTKELAENSVSVVGSKIGEKAASSACDIIAKNTSQVVKASENVATKAVEAIDQDIAELAKSLGASNKNVVKVSAEQVKGIAATLKEKAKELSDKEFVQLLERIGVKKDITNQVHGMFVKVGTGTARSSEKYLMKEFGFSADEAKYYVKGMREALNKANGVYDEKLKAAIAEELEKKIISKLKESAVPAFDKKLEQCLAAQFRKHHLELDDSAMALLKKSGREGFEEGLESAVKKVVKAAIEEALNRYRRQDYRDLSQVISTTKKNQENKLDVIKPQKNHEADQVRMVSANAKDEHGQELKTKLVASGVSEGTASKSKSSDGLGNSFLIGNIEGYNDASQFKVLRSQGADGAVKQTDGVLVHVSSDNKDVSTKAVTELVAAVKPSQRSEVKPDVVEGAGNKKVA